MCRGLPLTLLVTGILLVDDVKFTITTNQLAVHATLFDGRFDFHLRTAAFKRAGKNRLTAGKSLPFTVSSCP